MNTLSYSETAYHEQIHGISDRALPLIAQYRADKFSIFIRPDEDVLEFGCGPGWNLLALKAKRRVAHDVATFYGPALAKHGIAFIADPSDIPAHAFDVVISSHVLEHVLEPAKMLTDLARFLKPSGRLLLIVPEDRHERKARANDCDHHLYCWSIPSISNLVQACGYTIQSCAVKVRGFDRRAAELACGKMWLYRLFLFALRTIRPAHEIQLVLTK